VEGVTSLLKHLLQGTAERIVARRDQFVKCVKDIIYNGSSGLESVRSV
jgi:hypothetical protein